MNRPKASLGPLPEGTGWALIDARRIPRAISWAVRPAGMGHSAGGAAVGVAALTKVAVRGLADRSSRWRSSIGAASIVAQGIGPLSGRSVRAHRLMR
jgi:hypothetical protein